MPDPRSVSVSREMLATPEEARLPLLGFTELGQPLPAVPTLPHGQAVVVLSPKQNEGCPPGLSGVHASSKGP